MASPTPSPPPPSRVSPAQHALSNRLKAQFQDPDSDDDANASEDWFVNDVREAQPATSENNASVSPRSEPQQEPVQSTKAPASSPSPARRKHSSFSETEEDEVALLKTKTGFMHLRPLVPSVLILELCTSDPVRRRRCVVLCPESCRQTLAKTHGAKYFKVYLPQIVDSQIDFCLFGRKRLNKNKIRFSLSDTKISKWNNPSYVGKLTVYKTPKGHKFKIVCPKRKQRTVFSIEQDTRKLELKVQFHVQNQLFQLFQKASSPTAGDPSSPPSASCLLQKFLNPIADVRCTTTNTSLLKIDREGDAAYGKLFITYMRPFSMFMSACVAVALEVHQLEA
ncbi:Aste57867_5589 [Aphanomyces stellatus]|uniref:Aste57867_5589 protein n=1 Tax=Aphanomyces stellatus TaxID=120398 RepID=A0A485KGQ5_9STRA|nr:hypothetical protein As57867_005576 [Aphanomyces stellatus]VFT82635.1 Aste57867_5589 [Aphanomyces stellatus]